MLKLSFFVVLTVTLMVFINGFIFKNTGDDDKPAEEVYKNIKVFKGVPAKDILNLMDFMKASLNVRCSFCHLYNDKEKKLIFESDSLENKNTARDMIGMVKGINAQYFDGNMSVSCYTCHRGVQSPMRVPPLPQTPPVVQKKEQSANLPEAQTIFDNYYKALGIAKPDDIKSKHMKGTSALWDGKSFPVEIFQQAPDKFLSILTAPDGSKIYRGYDGNVGWTQDPEGIKDVEGHDLEKLKVWADFYKDINFLNKYSEVKVAGTDTVNGLNCYVVRGTINDNKSERLYFDTASGLLVRKITYTKSVLGIIPERIDFGNYKSTDGFHAPYSMRLSYLDAYAETIREFDEVKYNEPIDNIRFTKPVK